MFKTLITNLVAKHFKKKLTNLTIKEEDITELLEQIKISFLDADVNLQVTKDFLESIKKKVVGFTLSPGQDQQQYLIATIKEELVDILGKKTRTIDINKPLIKIMVVGLQGSGKTTTCGKLANLFKKEDKKKPMLVGIDVYRPAAIEQLRTLAKDVEVSFYEHGTQDPIKTSDEALTEAKKNGNNVIIFDTAGRLQTNEVLMDELVRIRNKVTPDEIIFIADGMSGQEIINVAKEFDKYLDLTGIIVTKLDGDARGGAALSLVKMLDIPILYTGTGEKIGSIEKFYPDRMADRILGLGDIVSLAEKAQDTLDKEKLKKSYTKMLSGKMDLEDLLIQTQEMAKVGNLGSVTSMLGANKITPEMIEEAEKKIFVWTVLINSMTIKERRNPHLFKKESSRKTRVVMGSGRTNEEFNRLIREWENSKTKMAEIGKKILKGMNPMDLLKNM